MPEHAERCPRCGAESASPPAEVYCVECATTDWEPPDREALSDRKRRRVSVGFTDSREGVLKAIYRMGVACCGYSHLEWSPRCDCKYGVADEVKPWPTLNETGNGCPELRSLYVVIEAMDDDEWYRLVQRAGGTPRGAVLNGDDIGQRLHRAHAAAAMAEHHIGEVRKALASDEQEATGRG